MTGWQIAALSVWLLYVGILLFGGSLIREQGHWVILGYLLLISGLGILRKLWDAILVRREIVAFRSMDVAQREEFLSRLWPRGLRYEYERRVDLDEGPEVEGSVERFPFSKAEQQLHWWLFGAAALLVGLPLIFFLAFPGIPLPLQAALLLVGGGALLPAAWLAGRIALLSTKLEVSPFGISLLTPLGRRTTVPFNQALLLRNAEAKGYYELRSPGGELQLRIHHAWVASSRAVRLIHEWGGFEPIEAPETGAT